MLRKRRMLVSTRLPSYWVENTRHVGGNLGGKRMAEAPAWQPPAPIHKPDKSKQLLAEAGYAKGFDAGEYNCDASYANIGAAVLDGLAGTSSPTYGDCYRQ